MQVGAWLTQRAQAVEEMTGQLHTAAQLLRLAQQFNPEDALARHLSTVASLQDGLQGKHPFCATSQRQVESKEGNVENCHNTNRHQGMGRNVKKCHKTN